VPSIEEEEAAEPPSAPASAPPTVAPQPVPIGPARDEAAAAPSAPPTEEAVQLKRTSDDPVADFPVDPLPVVTSEPEPATDAIAEEILPDLLTPLTVCVEKAPPLVASGVLPDDVRQLPAAEALPKPTAAVEPPKRDMLLMVASSAQVCPPTPPEPSTRMDDQKISPVEELAQGFTAVTLVMVDKPPDELLERPKTPRAFTDRDRECYYVTMDYGSSEDERNGAKPPEHDIPADA
jgi:hypothetical protein